MTDDAGNIETQRPMERDLLAAFMEYARTKKISTICRDCDTKSGWTIYTHKGSHQVIPGGERRDAYIGPHGIDVITMRCRNCGSIRMFDLNFVTKHTESNGLESTDAEQSEDHDAS